MRNGNVVMYNPVLTSLIACNTAAYLLGNTEQSKNALFYLSPYVAKNKVAISNCINILYDVYKDVIVDESRTSVAEDRNTNVRKVQLLLTRLTNRLDLLMEISDTQAAASLLGLKPEICSDWFGFIGVYDCMRYTMDNKKFAECTNTNEESEIDLLQQQNEIDEEQRRLENTNFMNTFSSDDDDDDNDNDDDGDDDDDNNDEEMDLEEGW